MSSAKRKLGVEETSSKPASKRPKPDTKPKALKASAAQKIKKDVHTPSKKPVASKSVSLLSKEQPAFPRGGAGLLTPIERKQIQAKASRDAAKELRHTQDLFGSGSGKYEDTSDEDIDTTSGTEVKKPEKKSRGERVRKDDAVKGSELRIGGLSHKRITTGSLILGQINNIGARALTIALPNNLVGYVPLTSISTQLSEKIQSLLERGNEEEAEKSDPEEEDEDEDITLVKYFCVGQYLRTAVTATEQERTGPKSQSRKRIELSIEPASTNVGLTRENLAVGVTVQASVSSVEDHGLAVDLALEDGTQRGFVLKKHLPEGLFLPNVMTGTVFLCSVLEIGSNNKVIKLSANLSKATTLKTTSSVDCFLPGTKAEILISNKTDTGIAGKVMGLLDVTADVVHSGSFKDKELFNAKYDIGRKISGRLIYTLPLSEHKNLGFSVLDHLLELRDPIPLADPAIDKLPLSSIVESASVVRVEPGLGVYLKLKEGILGFAHVSRLADKKIDSISEVTGSYKLGTEHKARILEYNPIDDLYILSLQSSILDQPFLRVDDVPVGAVVKGKVEKLLIGAEGVRGLIINLAEGITGLVPQIHLSDVELKHPERKFREGQAVSARVLSTDTVRRRLRLTLKKTLVNSDQKAWLSYESIEVGDSTVGTLVKVDRVGAIVQFFGSVKGFLPVSEMSEAFIKDATEHFRVGQVLTVNAISVNQAERRLTVSCRDVNSKSSSTETSLADLQSGTITRGTVFEKSQNDVLLRLAGSDAIARLVLDHISDGSLKKRESALSKIRVGQNLDNVLILQVQAKRRLVLVSNKQSLIKPSQAGTLLKSYEQLTEGAVFTGFVSNIVEDGVFVSFAAGISGLIPKSQIPIENESELDFGMSKMQPVTAKVTNIDYKGATPRFWLTMREGPSSASGPKTQKAEQKPDIFPLNDPVDPSLSSFSDLSAGKITRARIVSVKDTQMNVELAKDIQGRIDASEVFDIWEDIKDRKKPLKQFSSKQELTVRVLGAHDTRNHKFLPLTHRSSKNTVFELSCKPSNVKAASQVILSLQDMSVGSKWLAFVNNISDSCLWVNISPSIRGRVRATDISDDLSLVADLKNNFPIGSALRVHVLAVDVEKSRLDLSAKADGSASSISLGDISKGLILPGRVTKVTDRNILVQLSDQVVGAVDLIDMADDYTEANPAKYQKNDVLRVCVLKVDVANKKVTLSTRPSKVLSSSLPVTDPEITSLGQLSVNDVVRGFISNVADKGIFVTLGHGITAFVRISNLSDSYLKEWKDHFQRDQLVKGKVIMVDEASGQVQLSLKASALDPNYKPPLAFTDFHVGTVVTGKVVKVQSFGVFILIDNSENVRGLCHRSEIAEQRIEDASKLFNEGDKVKAKVLKLDLPNRRVNFGMKASYFADDMEEDSVDEQEGSHSEDSSLEEGGAELDEDMNDVEDNEDEDEDENADDDDDDDREGLDEDVEEEDSEDEAPLESTASVRTKGLNVGGFDWYGLSEPSQSSKRLASDSEDERPKAKATKKKKKRAEIQIDRTGDLDKDGPQSVDDYERLLLSEPDSSLLWLQYMAFHLDLGDADQARSIGERALKSIGLGQEAEKLNVWIALLNLENAYGDDETTDAIFQRACEYNDPQEIYTRLTSIYIQSGKREKADDLFQRMLKKFTQDPKVWINYATFLFSTADDGAEKARALLPRALQTLPKFTHFDITLKFAQLEFKHGLPERGRTIFEGLISAFPKRVDLFNVLLDLELKLEDNNEQIGGLFERIFAGKLKPKQAKYFFKRWLAFEEAQGDERKVEEVKARAAEWVRKTATTAKEV